MGYGRNQSPFDLLSSPSEGGGKGGWIPGAIASIAGMITDARQQKKTRQANIKMEREARAWNLAQWHRQNQYNNPIQQMARLKAAGLNPNLIYGSSPGSAVGNAGAVHPGSAPEQAYSNFVSPAISQFQNLKVQQAQTNNLKADVMLKGTQGLKNAADAGMTSRNLDLLNNKFDDLVGITRADAAISKIKQMIADKTSAAQIKLAMTKADKESIAKKLLDVDLEWAQAGFPKGQLIPQAAQALGFDLRNSNDSWWFKWIAGSAVGTRLFQSLSSGLKNLANSGKLLWGNPTRSKMKPPSITLKKSPWTY